MTGRGETVSWRQVAGAYGEVLRAEAGKHSFFAESLLPFPRALIKQALLEGVRETASANAGLSAQLEKAYVLLAHFVSDAEAAGLTEAEDLLRRLSVIASLDAAAQEQLKEDLVRKGALIQQYRAAFERTRAASEEYLAELKAAHRQSENSP
jgi:hypothetical protein